MDKYNFRSIGYFLKVADTLSFSKAAEELYITQPALSKCIRQLEDEIGVMLFHRSTKHVELTPGGQILYNEWKVWHDRSEELIHEARTMNGIGAAKIRVGIVEFSGVMKKVIPVINAFDDAHPELEIDFEILSYTDLRKRLANGDLDLIITLSTEVGDQSSSIHVRRLMDLQLYIIVPKRNHFYNNETLRFEDLSEETFCILDNLYSDEAKNCILDHCKALGFTPKNIKYYSNMRSMELSLAHSDYVTTGYNTFFDENNELKLFPIPNIGNSPEMVFAWKGELRKSTTEFLNYLQRELDDQLA